MSYSVCVVYHSGYGHTAKQAEAVAEGVAAVDGVECTTLAVDQLFDPEADAFATLDGANAIIMGCPTYMGSPSADMKRFMEASSGRWMEQKWADKLAAGFTNSGSQNGDKQNTLVGIATFAAQHGMVWINLNIMPGNNNSGGSVDDLNRLGASLGAMAQSNVDEGPDKVPTSADLETAKRLGQRVAECTKRWG
ncbi:MAG: flavodoxin family protein [Woeseiaceae bacterium]|nr:flavodoxin family protein [Woeseiaceae bacterium]